MDMPIYLHFLDGESGFRYRWFVIEERGEETAATDDELGEEHWIRKSKEDRVRDLRLPNLDYDVTRAAFAVSKSRIFFIGGHTVRRGVPENGILPTRTSEKNGILSIDLQGSDLSWKRCDKWAEELGCMNGAAVCDAEDTISVLLGDKILGLPCGDVEAGGFLLSMPSDFWPRFLLASFECDMILYKPGMSKNDTMLPFDNRLSQLTGISMRNDTGSMPNDTGSMPPMWTSCFHTFLPDPPCADWTYYPSPVYRCVMVKPQFLIFFALDFSPLKNTEDYCPGLYVYDMGVGKWLSRPVEGLPNDGIILPSLNAKRHISYGYLMRVRKEDSLKLAVVWTVDVEEDDVENGRYVIDQSEVHWCKFKLLIQDGRDDLTFGAKILSSGTCYGGSALLINCTAG